MKVFKKLGSWWSTHSDSLLATIGLGLCLGSGIVFLVFSMFDLFWWCMALAIFLLIVFRGDMD